MSANGILSIRNLRKTFGPLTALDDINLEVDRGKVVCAIGPSGSGKSTLLRCINFLEEPDSGEVIFHGERIGFAAGSERKRAAERYMNRHRAEIGMVFQHFNLWPHFTALQNIIEAPLIVRGIPRNEAIERAEQLLSRVGLLDKRDAYPSSLSGGQQQRVAIARALAMEPKIMLFDEPTSALDPELVGEVLSVMRELATEGMTMLVATHEMRFAADVADHVIFMDHGRVVESGGPSALFHNPSTERLQQFLSQLMQRSWNDSDVASA